jgi:hypothetical protein
LLGLLLCGLVVIPVVRAQTPADAALPTALARAPFEPARGCYVGAYIDLDHTVAGDIDTFEKLVGKKHASYFRYVGYGAPFPYKWVRDLAAKGAAAHIAWEPNSGLADVKDDDYLRGWAEAARRSGCVVFLRYASEMNGTWQAYSGNPEEYVAKWRIVYNVMHQTAPNVVMIWCPFSEPQRTIPMYYPGDDYVDWVGVNIYSVKCNDGDVRKPVNEDPRDALKYVYDLYAARKPIAICEYAATHYCAALKKQTSEFAVEQMTKLYTSLATDFPRVKMINWFSVDTAQSGLAHNDYSVTGDPQALAAYQKLMADPYFLASVDTGGTQIAALVPGGAPNATQTGSGSEATVKPLPGGARRVTTRIPLALSQPGPPPATGVTIAITGAAPGAANGKLDIIAQVASAVEVRTVQFLVDGITKGISNVAPYRCPWNADFASEGEHVLKVIVNDPDDVEVASAQAAIVVARKPQ